MSHRFSSWRPIHTGSDYQDEQLRLMLSHFAGSLFVGFPPKIGDQIALSFILIRSYHLRSTVVLELEIDNPNLARFGKVTIEPFPAGLSLIMPFSLRLRGREPMQ
jgi:hypothetical protein